MASTLAASFNYSPVSPVVGQTVTFTDASTGTPTSWSWSFGDGRRRARPRTPLMSIQTAGTEDRDLDRGGRGGVE
ncbi:MAG: PKD domain-containing protein [Desulfosudis oleivorans]|nr:PKD domain-containing protein [Desulfosudis oleivorans]